MRKITYDPALSDDEWREENFTDDQIAAAWESQRHGKQTAEELIEYAAKFGTEGVTECAIMLGQRAYQLVDEACACFDSTAPAKKRRAA